ncbi:hypothetical protein [Paenibacillus glacialis]|uniref:hypothetical protein n=1 Tax=Paenibacillus glacialis TaxID=494026 RepID=UPI000B0D9CA6|nr:hypothetical protein [Paenibacillus glacialis]
MKAKQVRQNVTQNIRVGNEQISAVEVKKFKSRIKELEEENCALIKVVTIIAKDLKTN